MNLKDALYGRRAVRDYLRQGVDEDVLSELIEAAVQAPSAMNQQPWAFMVVRDQAVLDRLSLGTKAHVAASAPVADHDHVHGNLDGPDFQVFYHAPVLIIIAAQSPGAWIVEDCTLAAANLMLAAYGRGLGSCWIGLAQAYLNTPAAKHLLAMQPDWVVVAPIIVGHPGKPAARPRPKDPLVLWVE